MSGETTYFAEIFLNIEIFFINSLVKFWIQKLCIRGSKNWKTCSWIKYYCDKLYIGILLEQLTVSWELFIAFIGKQTAGA